MDVAMLCAVCAADETSEAAMLNDGTKGITDVMGLIRERAGRKTNLILRIVYLQFGTRTV
jgi:hypothetical protein